MTAAGAGTPSGSIAVPCSGRCCSPTSTTRSDARSRPPWPRAAGGTTRRSAASPRRCATTIARRSPRPGTSPRRSRTLPIAARPAALRRYTAAIDPKAIYPFDRATLAVSDEFATCLRWPSSARGPDLGGPVIPDRPILVLSGRADLRTPLEQARALAGRAPRASVLAVPEIGHGVLGLACPNARVRSFLRGERVRRPCPGPTPIDVAPPWPATLAGLPPAPGTRGPAGRTVAALALALEDARTWGGHEGGRAGGMRGGWFSTGPALALHADRVVPGVALTGRLQVGRDGLVGTVRVSGAAATPGLLRVRGRNVSGRLGGRTVRSRLPRSLALG
jgi:hypothetical protein